MMQQVYKRLVKYGIRMQEAVIGKALIGVT